MLENKHQINPYQSRPNDREHTWEKKAFADSREDDKPTNWTGGTHSTRYTRHNNDYYGENDNFPAHSIHLYALFFAFFWWQNSKLFLLPCKILSFALCEASRVKRKNKKAGLKKTKNAHSKKLFCCSVFHVICKRWSLGREDGWC